VVLKNSNLFEVNQNFKNPYVESWNLAIQRSLPGSSFWTSPTLATTASTPS